jgi:hypothetical protein
MAATIVLMVNYLSSRHYLRKDISSTQFYALAPKTAQMLQSLEEPVHITVFFQDDNVLYEDIHNLLREYRVHSPLLNIQWVNPNRDIAQTEELAAKYSVTEANVVVFDCDGQNKYVRADEIAQIDSSSGEAKIVAFKGEQAFSSAIQAITKEDVPAVYFLAGHGEQDIENFDPRTGFSRIGQLIERDNVEVKKL